MNSDRQNVQIEHDAAVRRVVTAMVRCQTELYKAYTEDGEFREWLNGEMFRAWLLNQSQGGMCICWVLGIGAGISRECFGP